MLNTLNHSSKSRSIFGQGTSSSANSAMPWPNVTRIISGANRLLRWSTLRRNWSRMSIQHSTKSKANKQIHQNVNQVHGHGMHRPSTRYAPFGVSSVHTLLGSYLSHSLQKGLACPL